MQLGRLCAIFSFVCLVDSNDAWVVEVWDSSNEVGGRNRLLQPFNDSEVSYSGLFH